MFSICHSIICIIYLIQMDFDNGFNKSAIARHCCSLIHTAMWRDVPIICAISYDYLNSSVIYYQLGATCFLCGMISLHT